MNFNDNTASLLACVRRHNACRTARVRTKLRLAGMLSPEPLFKFFADDYDGLE